MRVTPQRNAVPCSELPPTAGLPLQAGDFFRTPAMPLPLALSEWLGIPDPVMACSGTAALVVALKVLSQQRPERTRVVVPAYTCPLVPLAVHLAGLKPVVCDTIPGGFAFEDEVLSSCCSPDTLAVIPTYLGGRVVDTASVVRIAHGCGAFVIDDAAQALGATFRGRSLGMDGDICFFSLAVGKGLTMYEGGILFSCDPALHTALRLMAEQTLGKGLFWNLRRRAELLGYAVAYRPSLLSYVYGHPLRKALARKDEVEAVGDAFTMDDIPLHRPDSWRLRIAANAFMRLPAFLDEGRARAGSRLAVLENIGLKILRDCEGGQGVWPYFMILMPSAKQRDQALDRLWREGLGISKLFVHALPDYGYLSGFVRGACPQARDFADRLLTLTNTHWLDDATFMRIADGLEASL